MLTADCLLRAGETNDFTTQDNNTLQALAPTGKYRPADSSVRLRCEVCVITLQTTHFARVAGDREQNRPAVCVRVSSSNMIVRISWTLARSACHNTRDITCVTSAVCIHREQSPDSVGDYARDFSHIISRWKLNYSLYSFLRRLRWRGLCDSGSVDVTKLSKSIIFVWKSYRKGSNALADIINSCPVKQS